MYGLAMLQTDIGEITMFDWSKLSGGELLVAAMQVSFECERCGKCCKGMQGIALNSLDTARMAKQLGIDKNDFVREYTTASLRKPSDRWYKTVGEDQRCPFLGEDGCQVYESRGQVCRFYPFYSPMVQSRAKKTGVVTVFSSCKGMARTYQKILIQAKTLSSEVAHQILNGDIGKICYLYMVIDEGKAKTAEIIAKELGYVNLPDRESLREQAWMYATAWTSLMGERKIDGALAEVEKYV
jgi:Fe-S-cluster containining protein